MHIFSPNGFIPQMHTFSHCIHLHLVCRIDYKSKMPQNCEHFLKYSTIIPAYLRFNRNQKKPQKKIALRRFLWIRRRLLFKSGLFLNKKETPEKVFLCEYFETCKNVFFYRAFLGDCSWQITIYIQWAKMQWRTNVIDQSLRCFETC